eukprot:scaffold14518_cov67-Skeletonema_dohrnii-CCMP3373.AAC.3
MDPPAVDKYLSRSTSTSRPTPSTTERSPKGRSRRLERIFCYIIIYTIMSFFVLVYLDLDGGGEVLMKSKSTHDDTMKNTRCRGLISSLGLP